ncbi:hypothetical protein KUV28_10145 [Ferrimonas balearica]|nr:hypothetical protein [Ferrimonas balearica]
MIYLCGFLSLALIGLSAGAYLQLPRAGHLPMQWGLDGRPTWSAPRGLALCLTPLLAGGVALLFHLVADAGPAAIALILGVFTAAHVLHLVLVRRHLTQD